MAQIHLFVSLYTPHTAHRNAYFERPTIRALQLAAAERPSQGMVTFLPAGDVSHRSFVTHAWADNPIKDILLRMDESDLKIETAGEMQLISAGTLE